MLCRHIIGLLNAKRCSFPHPILTSQIPKRRNAKPASWSKSSIGRVERAVIGWLYWATTVAATSWPESSRASEYGGRGWASPTTPSSSASSNPHPHGIPSCASTTPNPGLRSSSNSAFELSSSTKLASLSSSAPIPLLLRNRLLLLSLFPSSIQLVSSCFNFHLLLFLNGNPWIVIDAVWFCRFAIARWWRVLHAGECSTRCWCFVQYGVVQG